jgi:hypothetical protein
MTKEVKIEFACGHSWRYLDPENLETIEQMRERAERLSKELCYDCYQKGIEPYGLNL